jgi:chromatin remodeling complex protein RSC6
MFSFAPRQVEPTIIPKKGRKNKEIALEHFEKSMVKIEESVVAIESIIKLQDPTVIEMRKNLRNALREVKEVRKYLTKYKNIQYKPKRTRESHNTGLEKLRPISESMALFADWECGKTQKSRYDVTNVLCSYIKENELRDPDNRTIIVPDAKLKELLQVEDEVVLKYPTMQKYLKNCFEEVVEEPQSDDKDAKQRGRKKESSKVVEEPKNQVKKPVKKEVKEKAKKESKTKK